MKKIVLLLSFFWPFAVMAGEVVITSPADSKSYRTIILGNGLKVMLVSDPQADKAAASLDIYVGSGSDPEGREGLAHFLEHMLFLGTEKYPEAGEYQAFIQANGGSNNAYTSFDHTNYYFDINPGFLMPALDRFAQFFVAPLFTEEFVQRERYIVQSEFQARFKEDGRRLWAASRRAMNPQHPMSRFSVGSTETLADRPDTGIRDELIAFYQQFYSAGIMALTVIGREPLDLLQKWVEERFSKIPNTGIAAQSFELPIYGKERLPVRLDLIPEKAQHQISFTFPIPSTFSDYATKPVQYIANILGHEGAGSLLSLLRERGWAEGLGAGAGYMGQDQGTFVVSVAATAEGIGHVDEIGELLFQAIRLIVQKDMAEWRYREEQRLAELAFRYREEHGEASYARALSANMQRYPMSEAIYGSYRMDNYEPETIRRYLQYLQPENLLLTVVDKGLETDAVTPWYRVAYRLKPIAEKTLALWQSDSADAGLHLPPPNPFIPQQLELAQSGVEADTRPIAVTDVPGIRLWHRQDTSFGAPRAGFYFSVQSPLASASAHNVVLIELYVRLVQDQLKELSYPAYLAGLSYELYRHSRGFSVRIKGYNDRQATLLEKIVAALLRPDLSDERFERFKKELARELSNEAKEPPSDQTMRELYRLLMKPRWSETEQLEALQKTDVVALRELLPALLKKVSLVALSHGNVTQEEARRLATVLQQRFGSRLQDLEVSRPRVRVLETALEYERRLELEHSDSGFMLYLQGEDKSIQERAKAYMLGQLLEAPFYYSLRTVQQAGYIVFASPVSILEVPGVMFTIQSPAFKPGRLYTMVQQFLNDFGGTLAAMDKAEFQAVRDALVATILQKDRKLSERTSRYWREIDRRELGFDSRRRLAQAVVELTLNEMSDYYQRLTASKRGRRIMVTTTGGGGEGADTLPESSHRRQIDDSAEFRDGDGSYFPEY